MISKKMMSEKCALARDVRQSVSQSVSQFLRSKARFCIPLFRLLPVYLHTRNVFAPCRLVRQEREIGLGKRTFPSNLTLQNLSFATFACPASRAVGSRRAALACPAEASARRRLFKHFPFSALLPLPLTALLFPLAARPLTPYLFAFHRGG